MEYHSAWKEQASAKCGTCLQFADVQAVRFSVTEQAWAPLWRESADLWSHGGCGIWQI